jgi:hypothetical protein
MSAPSRALPLEQVQAAFLTILPRIELHAQIYFRGLKCPHRRADAVQETFAVAWKWFARLMERGKDPLTFPAVFASYAARAVKCGRRVCGQEKGNDVLSSLARHRRPGHALRVDRASDVHSSASGRLASVRTSPGRCAAP